METLKKFAKASVQSIDDPFERKQAQQEVYATLMDAYDEVRADYETDAEAIHHVISNFGEDPSNMADLKASHMRSFGKKQIVSMLLIGIVFVVILYVLIYLLFSGRLSL